MYYWELIHINTISWETRLTYCQWHLSWVSSRWALLLCRLFERKRRIAGSICISVGTRMHSSRMRTGRSLIVCRGGGPGSDPPQFLPWVWALAGRECLLGRGVSLAGGGCLLLGGQYPSMHWVRPPLADRITDTSENITLATTSLRPVKI